MGLINNVFILVNANSIIGSGHLVRCRIIAEELLKYNIKSVFIFSDTDPKYSDNISKLFDVIIIDKQPSNILENILNEISRFDENKLLIIDSDNCDYYTEHFQKRIINSGIKLMYITINSEYYFYSHIILNQNIIALEQEYKSKSYTKKLLGPDFFILSEKLREFNISPKSRKKTKLNLFVAFGGADYYNLTSKIIECLSIIGNNFESIDIILGGLNNNYENINHQIDELNINNIQVHYNTQEIYNLMDKADIAICSSGLTFWELAIFNVPSFMIASSEREKYITDYLDSKQYCKSLGHFDTLPSSKELAKTIDSLISEDYLQSINLNELNSKINLNGVEKVVDEIFHILNI